MLNYQVGTTNRMNYNLQKKCRKDTLNFNNITYFFISLAFEGGMPLFTFTVYLEMK